MRKLLLIIKIYRKIKLEKRKDAPGFFYLIISLTDVCNFCRGKDNSIYKTKPGWLHIVIDKKGNMFISDFYRLDKGWGFKEHIEKGEKCIGYACSKCMVKK